MSEPNFTTADFDRYDAERMSLRELERCTIDHPKDCECAYCTAREIRREQEANHEP